MFKINCLESLTAIGFAGAAACTGGIDVGLAAGAVVGLAGLFARLQENAEDSGLDTHDIVRKMELAVLREMDRYDDSPDTREAIGAAVASLNANLPQLDLTRHTLARSSTESVDHPYPEFAAIRIVDALAELDPMFAAPADPALPNGTARDFALRVVRRSLQTAMENEAYAVRLTLDLVVETNRALAQVLEQGRETRRALDEGQAAILTDLAEIRALLGARVAMPDEALRKAVAEAIGQQPDSTPQELANAVRHFAEQHEMLVAKVALIEVFDNRLASFKSEADEALARYDHARAAECYRAAREAIDVRIAEQARASAQFAFAEADALLLDRNWRGAIDPWEQALALLGATDPRGAANEAWEAAYALRDYCLDHRNYEIDVRMALLERWLAVVSYEQNAGERCNDSNVQRAKRWIRTTLDQTISHHPVLVLILQDRTIGIELTMALLAAKIAEADGQEGDEDWQAQAEEMHADLRHSLMLLEVGYADVLPKGARDKVALLDRTIPIAALADYWESIRADLDFDAIIDSWLADLKAFGDRVRARAPRSFWIYFRLREAACVIKHLPSPADRCSGAIDAIAADLQAQGCLKQAAMIRAACADVVAKGRAPAGGGVEPGIPSSKTAEGEPDALEAEAAEIAMLF